MQVLVRKDVSSRWLNRIVVMVLVAMIAIQLSAYLTPEEGVARERARAQAAVAWNVQGPRTGAQFIAAKYAQEKEEANAKLEGLARKVSEIESQSDRKLAKTIGCPGPAETGDEPANRGARPLAREDGGPDRQNKARLDCPKQWSGADSGCEVSFCDSHGDHSSA